MLRLLCATLIAVAPDACDAMDATDQRSIVITTDCGVDMDDQWAIAHAALSPRLRTLAVIGNFAPEPHDLGPSDTAECAREALGVVERLTTVRVIHGAERPMRNRATPALNEGGLDLIRLSQNFSASRRLAVLAFGPATDIASAILIEPAIVERIEVVALAFDTYPQGGDGWNVRNDIPAWRVVLDSDVPVTAASGYVALESLNLTRGASGEMFKELGAPGAYLASLHATWLAAFGQALAGETGGSDRWPVWDEAVVGVVLGHTVQRELPRPRLADDGSFAFPNSRSDASFRWVVSVHREQLLGDFADLLGQTAKEADRPEAASRPGLQAGISRTAPTRCIGWMCRARCVAQDHPLR
jgi:inosine-uridine nucleoside N-ribohydrolase